MYRNDQRRLRFSKYPQTINEKKVNYNYTSEEEIGIEEECEDKDTLGPYTRPLDHQLNNHIDDERY